ncbi:putative nuclease HARBI1 [Microcaecilia unicolor]|uniref:Putative nuclease HARBI1 n=1 Tax=Microcaecilia unicolor TaxID=1415580 RepID=A0A6P7Y0H5_9AMPH|nr:putative nuclease HARBI1 [Microcaecilia unicolor]
MDVLWLAQLIYVNAKRLFPRPGKKRNIIKMDQGWNVLQLLFNRRSSYPRSVEELKKRARAIRKDNWDWLQEVGSNLDNSPEVSSDDDSGDDDDDDDDDDDHDGGEGSLADISDRKILDDYRLCRTAIYELYQEIRHDIDPSTARSHAVPGLLKLLTILQFFATGTFQHVLRGNSGVDQATVSRHLSQVLRALKKCVRKYIAFPTGEEEWRRIKMDFYKIAGMPSVLGAIDCTHVAFTPPAAEEMQYRNRKMGYSLNVQAVCDAHLRILDVVTRFPGSCHDSYILSNSALGKKFAEGKIGNGLLLGDAGNGCRTWLLTPLAMPRSDAEKHYNEAHISTRCTIEHTFGVLKSRFRCLHISGGSLQYSPEKVADIVLVCCMLHKIALNHHLDIEIVVPPEVDITPSDKGSDVSRGSAVRKQVIQTFFSKPRQPL